MGTTREFQSMLNEFLPNELLAEELIKRDYILQKVAKDDSWKGGSLIVPFKRAGASSVKFGGLTAVDAIVQSDYQRGSVDDYVEVWGSLIFNHRDLQEHNGKIPESTFLRLLPDELEDHMQYFKEVVSVQVGSGPHFAKGLSNGGADGTLIVDKIANFQVNQLFTLDDGATAAADVYVKSIDVNLGASGYPGSGTIIVSATKGGGALDISAYALADSPRCYHPGVFDSGGSHVTFVSMRQALLSATNGGSSQLHGKTKTASPILQAVNIDGASITATNILDKIFDGYTEVRAKGKGMADTVLMSFKHLGSVMKAIELEKSPYKQVGGTSVNKYGWTEIVVTSVKGSLTLVGIQEMDDDIMPIIDWKSMKFYSNGGFKKRISPKGEEFYEIRNTTGYQYVVDTCFFGEMVYAKPGHNGIIFGITAY